MWWMQRTLAPALALAWLVAAEPARADDKPAPPRARGVNLLVSAPATVAVSSTVANAKILPEHLVDGDPATAWNSRTGDVVGAWIAFRVPADAFVYAIRMSAGFTLADKRGDLFTMNPRLKRVRVSRAGKLLGERVLDPAQRGLQELAVGAPGGDFKIEIVEVVPGSKPAWREACVSELEVWGTLAAGAAPVPSRPAIRIGSLDAPALSGAACARAVFPRMKGNRIGPGPADDVLAGTDVVALGGELFACRLAHAAKGDPTTTTVVAAVRHGARTTVLGKATFTTTTAEDPSDQSGRRGGVELAAFPLTTTEHALLVEVSQGTYGPMHDAGTLKSTLYRVGAAGLTEVLDFESTWDDGEATDSDRCKLAPPARLTAKLPDLELECTISEGRFHGQDPRGDGVHTTDRTERYRWTGTRYVKR